jgi:hypothetical protein
MEFDVDQISREYSSAYLLPWGSIFSRMGKILKKYATNTVRMDIVVETWKKKDDGSPSIAGRFFPKKLAVRDHCQASNNSLSIVYFPFFYFFSIR